MHFISEKGILHLDLATRNVLLTHPAEVAKISDFGLSKFMDRIEEDEKFGTRGRYSRVFFRCLARLNMFHYFTRSANSLASVGGVADWHVGQERVSVRGCVVLRGAAVGDIHTVQSALPEGAQRQC